MTMEMGEWGWPRAISTAVQQFTYPVDFGWVCIMEAKFLYQLNMLVSAKLLYQFVSAHLSILKEWCQQFTYVVAAQEAVFNIDNRYIIRCRIMWRTRWYKPFLNRSDDGWIMAKFQFFAMYVLWAFLYTDALSE